MTRTRPILCALAVVVLARCGGSASPAYEGESTSTATEGADAPMADDGAGGEATEADTGGAMVAEPGMPPQQVTRSSAGSDLYSDLVQASIDLDQATTLSTVDCSSARDLRDRICDLSERICGIAQDHPDDDSTAERCRDGRARCEGATNRVDQTCP